MLNSFKFGSQLTAAEVQFVQNLNGLSYAQGDILYFDGSDLNRLSAGTSGFFLKTQGAGANPVWSSVTAGAAGNDTEVQFNDGGASLGGDADFTWNKTTNILTVAGGIVIGSSNPFSDSAGTLTLQNVDAIDATTESTIEAAIDTLTLSSLTMTTAVTAILDEDNMASDSATALATQQSIKAYVDSQSGIGGTTGSVDNVILRADGTGGSTVQASSATATLSDNNDLTLYDATNDGNPVFAFGASATERLTIIPTYDTGAQTLDYVEFATAAASATADKGEFRFNVDGTLIATIDDGGIEIKASGSLSFGAVDILTDSTGTTTLNNIDALDATTEDTIEAAIDTLANLTSVQGLTVTLADAGANAIFGWDDVAGAYENLTQAEVLGVIGDAAADGSTKGVSTFTASDFDAASGVVSIDYANGQKATTSQAGFVSELATTTETNTGTDTTRAVTPDGLSSAVKSIMLTAAGGSPLTTAGCSDPTKVEEATNDINYYVLDFDGAAEEHAFWGMIPMPENWDGGVVNAQFYWTNASGASPGDGVVWGIAGGSWGDDDALDAALGTEISTTDTVTASGDLMKSAKSSDITIANAAPGELINIVVARKVGDASDDMTEDARLIAVKLTYTIDQYSDEI